MAVSLSHSAVPTYPLFYPCSRCAVSSICPYHRFKGEILPGAMPWTRRYIGNPILSGMLRVLFGTYISDSHCGMRSFTTDAYKRMNLRTTGMEFASEMVIKAVETKLKILEIPITYHPRAGESKLNAIRDALRHIRFMLKYKFSHRRTD